MKEIKITKEQDKKAIKKQKGITLIALVITIIVLLILAGVSIAMLTGNNGILTQANKAKVEQSNAAVKESISLAYNEWQIEVSTGTAETFLQFIESKGYIKEGTTDILDVEKLTGSKQALGNGEDTDVYKIKEQDGNYILSYYDTENKEEQLWSVPVSTESSGSNISYNDELKTLKPGDYVIYDTGVAETGEVICRVLYDANSEYGLQIITDDCIKENGEYLPIFLGGDDYAALESYNNAIKTLNEKAMKYLNENIALDARCVGTNPKNKEAESEEFAEYEGKKYPVKAEDKNYETDYDMLNKLNILNIEVPYWLASRYTEYGRVYFVNGIICYIRMVGQEMEAIYKIEEGYSIKNTVINALRPVFTLRGDLKIVSGDGKSEGTAYRFN